MSHQNIPHVNQVHHENQKESIRANVMTESMKQRKKEAAREKAAATRRAKAAEKAALETDSFKLRKKEAAREKAAATRRAKAAEKAAAKHEALKPLTISAEREERRKAILKRFHLNTATRRRQQMKNPYVKTTNDWNIY